MTAAPPRISLGGRELRWRFGCFLFLAGALFACYVDGLTQRSIRGGLLWACGVALLAAGLCPLSAIVKVTVMVVSGTSVLVGADLLWRLHPPAQLAYRPEETLLFQWPPMSRLARYDANATFDAWTYGDLAAMAGRRDWREYRRLTFHSDSRGFPNQRAPVGGANVLLLGDSFGAGTGTRQEATWASLLAERYHLQVYNLSVSGTGPWHELIDLKIELPRIAHRPKTVVLWAIFAGNDLDDHYEANLEPALSTSRWEQLRVSLATFRHLSPIHRVVEATRHRGKEPPAFARQYGPGRTILFRPIYARRVRRSLEEVRTHPNHPGLLRVFEEMRRFAAREGLTVAVAMLPTKEEVYSWLLDGARQPDAPRGPSPLSVVVEEQCRLHDFAFLDLKPLMAAEAHRLFAESSELLWWSDDTHWNELGHAFAAASVYENLLRPELVR